MRNHTALFEKSEHRVQCKLRVFNFWLNIIIISIKGYQIPMCFGRTKPKIAAVSMAKIDHGHPNDQSGISSLRTALRSIISSKVASRTRLLNGPAQFWQNEPNSIGNGGTPAGKSASRPEVLAEFGFGSAEIAALRQAKAV
jgi:hypothetical protein